MGGKRRALLGLVFGGCIALSLISPWVFSQTEQDTEEPLQPYKIRSFAPPSDGFHGVISLGERSLQGSGKASRYRKYRFYPQDLDFPLLHLGFWQRGYEYFSLEGRSPLERDRQILTTFSLPYPYINLQGGYQRYEFFLDPRAETSERREVQLSGVFLPPVERLWVKLERPLQEVRISKQEVVGGRRQLYSLHFFSRDVIAQTSYSLGAGSLGLEYRRELMEDRSRLLSRAGTYWFVQPRDTHSTQWNGYVTLGTLGFGGLQLSYSNTSGTSFQGGTLRNEASHSIQQWSLEWFKNPGDWDLGLSFTGLSASRPSTLSSWARRSFQTSFVTAYRPLQGLSLQTGYSRKKVNWISRRKDFGDPLVAQHPVWNILWFEGRYHPRSFYQARLRWQDQRLGNLPELGEARPGVLRPFLWYDRQRQFQVYTEAHPWSFISFYSSWQKRRQESQARKVTFSRREFSLGSWVQLTRGLELSIDWNRDTIATKGLIDDFGLKNRAYSVALNFQPRRDWSVDVSFNRYTTSGTEVLRQNLVTLSWGFFLSRHQKVTVELQRDHFRNLKDPETNYKANVLWVKTAYDF